MHNILTKFWSYVKKDIGTDCLIWTGSVNSYGNPKFHYQKREYMACKFIYEQVKQTTSTDVHVRHTCGNKLCVNIDHLYIKTDLKSIQKRFASKVRMPESWEKDPTGKCWEWIGGLDGNYGIFIVEGQHIKAHRFSYESHYGPIPDGLVICHACDNPICVNFHHLFPGTPADNVKDMYNKGRQAPKKLGEDHPNSKLTEVEVLTIRSLIGTKSLCKIAEQFSISRPVVAKIRDRELWQHI